MKITLNNRIEHFDAENITFEELLKLKNYTFRLLVTKLNGKLIRKEERDTTIISDGDIVMVIHLISGG
ncbi:MAG TPA: sulfur carrier protein ThiS [Bacteroidales bacterium]|nr:sulfur carrier protein ThiS [Bacteroidales bacterium]HPR56943.1 sulfur carrier protein ThiS [Bacteroidales bacterium]